MELNSIREQIIWLKAQHTVLVGLYGKGIDEIIEDKLDIIEQKLEKFDEKP